MSKDKIGEHPPEECATCRDYHKKHKRQEIVQRVAQYLRDTRDRLGNPYTDVQSYALEIVLLVEFER